MAGTDKADDREKLSQIFEVPGQVEGNEGLHFVCCTRESLNMYKIVDNSRIISCHPLGNKNAVLS